MEKSVERNITRRIVRAVASRLADVDFRLTKPTFATRAGKVLTPFFHFHKFSFAPAFRIHAGIRVMNEPFEAVALNGPTFQHEREFSAAASDIDECIVVMAGYCTGPGMRWVERWADPTSLLAAPDSPLHEDARAALRAALAGEIIPEHVAQSERLLGLARVDRTRQPSRPVV